MTTKQRIFPSTAILTQRRQVNGATSLQKPAPCKGLLQQRAAPSSSLGCNMPVPREMVSRTCRSQIPMHDGHPCNTTALTTIHVRMLSMSACNASQHCCQIARTTIVITQRIASIILLQLASQAAPHRHQRRALQCLPQQWCSRAIFSPRDRAPARRDVNNAVS